MGKEITQSMMVVVALSLDHEWLWTHW